MGDERRIRALHDMRRLGDGVLAALGESRHSGSIEYRLETRFSTAIGSFALHTEGERWLKPPLIRVQYPLWEYLTDQERELVVAHEHAHFVQFLRWRKDDHGAEWRSLMEKIGYSDAGPAAFLNANAREYLRSRKVNVAKEDRATIWVEKGWICIRTPYNDRFVNEIKADFPSNMRRFDPQEKIWKVAASYADDVMSLIKKYFGDPTIIEPEVQVVAVAGSDKDPYGVLLRAAPDDVLKKVYVMIAAKVHPDAGGSNEKMAEVNAAWDVIKKERKL